MKTKLRQLKACLCFSIVFVALILAGCAATPQKADDGNAMAETGASSGGESKEGSLSVTSIDIVGSGDSVLIETTEKVKYTVFKLNDPPRLILDINGVDVKDVAGTELIDNEYVREIAVSGYSVSGREIGRIEIGLKGGVEHLVKPGEEGILVKLTSTGPKPAAFEPMAADPVKAEGKEYSQAVPETVQASATSVDVVGVDFHRFPETARLTVRSSSKARYSLKRSLDGKMVTIDLLDADIGEELVRTMDATALNTPVVSISSYRNPVGESSEVRVLVRLTEETPYDVIESDESIVLDFALPRASGGSFTAAPGEEGLAYSKEVVPVREPESFNEALASRVVAEKSPLEASGDQMEGSPLKEAPFESGMKSDYAGRRIDLDMVDVDIADILKLLAEISDLNIIATDNVTGKVTMRLHNVPWDQAFDLILTSKGLGKVQVGNVIRVAPLTQLRKEKEEAIAAAKASEKLDLLVIEYLQVNYGEAKDIIPHIEEVLSDRGTVTSHEATNTLIVKDTLPHIGHAEKVLEVLDKIIPQVLIEARIVEATTNFARDLGIQWGVDFRADSNGGGRHISLFGSQESHGQFAGGPDFQNFTSDGDATAFGGAKQDLTGKGGVTNYAVNLPSTGTASNLGALGFILGNLGANPLILDLRLTAGEQEGFLKTISRPRITTMNNKEAKIEQGESIPFETTSATGTSTTFIDANLSLMVTPQITPDGSVLLKIKASRNSIGSFRTSTGEPSIDKKEAHTEVLVRDGETTVIGGIVVSETTENESGIPFFKDIPFLGWLFKNQSIVDNQKELLIFITPTILSDLKEIG